jgi:hypothetical protein
MDTKTLIAEARARFNHNAAKAQLKDKYDGKLIVADQNGLWSANIETICALEVFDNEFIVLIDNFNNPVRVNRSELLSKLKTTYTTVMEQWYKEWSDLEKKR